MAHSGDTLPDTYIMELVAACLSAELETLRTAVRHPHARARILGLRGLARANALTDDDWSRLCSDPEAEVRRETLAEMGPRGACRIATAQLIALLGDPDPLVAEAAAYVAGECHVGECESALMDMVSSHEDARCRETAVVALGSLGKDSSRATIVAALVDKPTVRRRAVVALANFEGDDIEEALDRAAEDRDWQVRSAVELLRRND
jgi:hypothetical protein